LRKNFKSVSRFHNSMSMKKLSEIFSEILIKRGIDKVGSLSKRIPNRESKNPIQDIAIAVLENKGVIAEIGNPTALAWDLRGNKTKGAKFAFVPLNSKYLSKFSIVLKSEDIMRELEKHNYPLFIIDLMHWEKHTLKEKRKVALQVAQSYGVIRDYLWGDLLNVTWVNEEFKKLAGGLPIERVSVYEISTADFLKKEGIDEVILLDPRAEEDLSREDFNVKAFIIGGIVDMGGTKKGTTTQIGKILEESGIKVRRRKITLRGDIFGVPDRINHILEIVLKMLVEDKSMEEAILDVQAPIQARWRLRKELPKHAVRFLIDGKKFLVVEKELYKEFSEWLNIRWEDFVQVLRELNFVALERKRLHHLKKISTFRLINGKGHWVLLTKRAALLCYNC